MYALVVRCSVIILMNYPLSGLREAFSSARFAFVSRAGTVLFFQKHIKVFPDAPAYGFVIVFR